MYSVLQGEIVGTRIYLCCVSKVQSHADPRLTEHAKPVQMLCPTSSKSWKQTTDLNDKDEGLTCVVLQVVSSENHDSGSKFSSPSAEVDRVHWYTWELLWRPDRLVENAADLSGHAYDLAVVVGLYVYAGAIHQALSSFPSRILMVHWEIESVSKYAGDLVSVHVFQEVMLYIAV